MLCEILQNKVTADAKIYIFTGRYMLACPFQVKAVSPFVRGFYRLKEVKHYESE